MVNLERMRLLKKKIPGEQMDKLRAMARATKVSPGQLDGMPHGTSVGNPVLEGVILIEEVTEAYQECITELHAMQQELTPLIDLLTDPDEIAFMRMFYIKLYTIPAISEMLTVSGRTICDRQVQRTLHDAEDNLVRLAPDSVVRTAA